MTDSNQPLRTSGRSSDQPSVSIERRSPDSVFSLLGNDTRVRILQTLGETPAEDVPFGDLHRRVAVSDSGQFNYHLNKLLGTFIRKTAAGYRLTQAGRQVVGAMLAGTYTVDARIDSIPVKDTCLVCGSELVAGYADETATIECTICDEWRIELPFPPGSLDQYDVSELPNAFDRWMRHVIGGIVEGFCPICAGRTTGSLVGPDPDGSQEDDPFVAEYGCKRCGSETRTSPAVPALFHPAVEGFLYYQGVDMDGRNTWNVEDVLRPDISTEAEDPLVVRIRFKADGEAVEVSMDKDAQIRSVKRRSGVD